CWSHALPLLPKPTLSPLLGRATLATPLVFGLALLLMAPLVVRSRCWKGNRFKPRAPFHGDFAQDYGSLCRTGRLPSSYPLPLVAFLRDKLPPNRVVMARDTFSVVLTTNHFVAVLAGAGDPKVPIHYVLNWNY